MFITEKLTSWGMDGVAAYEKITVLINRKDNTLEYYLGDFPNSMGFMFEDLVKIHTDISFNICLSKDRNDKTVATYKNKKLDDHDFKLLLEEIRN